jgi:hypothetical protein
MARLKSGRAAQACYREMRNRNYGGAVSACSEASRLTSAWGTPVFLKRLISIREFSLDGVFVRMP